MSEQRPGCPVCASVDLERTVERPQIPAMQNYVYRTADHARAAKIGRLGLAVCRECGFAFNGDFLPDLLDYDQGYDNSVPSSVMGEYYAALARHLNASYLHDQGLIVDVGCGKGTFLRTLTQLFPRVRGLGIDPSYEGPLEDVSGSLRFIREIFAEDQLTERPSLVICRHVLEHMNRPVVFLQSLYAAARAFPGVPFFVEVPDLNWIVQHQAFWDFCYEHCNYFTPTSLENAMYRAGFRTTRSRTAFGDQYIWLEAVAETAPADQPLQNDDGIRLVNRLQQYRQAEEARIERARGRLAELSRQQWKIVVWGMATKGILFSYLVDPQHRLIDHCIDVNRNKQGCFVPVTGHLIESPDVLPVEFADRLAIVVMNENYLNEIAATCRDRGLNPAFLNASGESLSVSARFD